MKPGNVSKRQREFLRHLGQPGGSVVAAAAAVRLGDALLARWLKNPAFAARLDLTLDAARDRRRVELELLAGRAVHQASCVLDGAVTLKNANQRHVLIALLRMANAKSPAPAKPEAPDVTPAAEGDDAAALIAALTGGA